MAPAVVVAAGTVGAAGADPHAAVGREGDRAHQGPQGRCVGAGEAGPCASVETEDSRFALGSATRPHVAVRGNRDHLRVDRYPGLVVNDPLGTFQRGDRTFPSGCPRRSVRSNRHAHRTAGPTFEARGRRPHTAVEVPNPCMAQRRRGPHLFRGQGNEAAHPGTCALGECRSSQAFDCQSRGQILRGNRRRRRRLGCHRFLLAEWAGNQHDQQSGGAADDQHDDQGRGKHKRRPRPLLLRRSGPPSPCRPLRGRHVPRPLFDGGSDPRQIGLEDRIELRNRIGSTHILEYFLMPSHGISPLPVVGGIGTRARSIGGDRGRRQVAA